LLENILIFFKFCLVKPNW